MKKSLKILEKATAYFAVFFLPSQLAFHFWIPDSFIFGIRVDYMSPAIFFTDLLVLFLLVLFILNDGNQILNFIKKNKYFFLCFLCFVLLNTLFSTNKGITFFKWLKMTEFIFLGIYFFIRKTFLGEGNILKIFLSSTVLVSLIGILQFFLGRTTGIFYLLGERSFTAQTPGIALTNLNGVAHLRSYSVFSHPNSLSGYLGIALLTFIFSKILKRKKIWYFSLLIILFCFTLTFSLSAYIAGGVLIAAYLMRNFKILTPKLLEYFLLLSVTTSLLLPIYSEQIIKNLNLPENLEQRIELSYISGKMAGDNFLVGQGFNTFIINSVSYKGTNTYSWLLQPVHNIFLLVLTEEGILGVLFLVFIFFILIRKSERQNNYLLTTVIFFILFTGLSDHYWLTLQQNLLLFPFITGLTLQK